MSRENQNTTKQTFRIEYTADRSSADDNNSDLKCKTTLKSLAKQIKTEEAT